jgi:hypothetical protein
MRGAETIAAEALASEVAGTLGVPFGLAWDCLCTVPDNMLGLLDSPQGWSALAGFIAGDLGACPSDYKPKVH